MTAHYSIATQRVLQRLDYYYQVINATILSKQNAVSGLMPASVAITTHGDYTDAWVRDNVYSIYAVYGLALAYRRVDNDNGRAFELEHAVIKLMRGLLFAMMRQAKKVEQFKKTQALEHSLHAKYNTTNGETVVGDFDWGHLQIDATSFFLVALADMTTSGFTIVYTQDEVDFVQNLVFYIERAYRTPDYGIWERGNKSNHGQPELNSSSIGMALAALRAINGVNLFGARGGPTTVIHVLPDELTRNATTLHSFLPRESNSKEIDGSVLSVIGFPAFAVNDPDLIRRSKQEAKEKLEGKYGWKRFLRDGHQTVLEDTSRLHYNLNELKIFENIESEWPLFFTYLVLEGLFTGDLEQAEEYRKKLEPLIIDSTHVHQLPMSPGGGTVSPASGSSSKYSFLSSNGTDPDLNIPLVAELYYVPPEYIDAEKANPHSQPRSPNDNLPLVWALSLYFLGKLIEEDLLSPSEVDPLGRRFAAKKVPRQHIVQIVLLSEDEALQSTLSMYGLETQTMGEIASNITILHPRALTEVYAGLGRNSKLGLSGRPKRPVGVLGTSRLYRIQGQIYAFTPHFMDNEEFYLNSDPDYLVSAFESELSFTSQNWFYPGRPTMVVVLTNALLGAAMVQHQGKQGDLTSITTATSVSDRSSQKNLLNFFMNLRCGESSNGVRVRLCRLTESINTSNIESLDFLINQPDMNWESILLFANRTARNRRRSIHRKLGYDEGETQANTPGSKTPRRRNTAFHGKSLASPLDRLNQESYFEQLSTALSNLKPSNAYEDDEPQFKLKDPEQHNSSPSARKTVSATLNDVGSTTEESSGSPFPGADSASSDRPPSESPADMLALMLGDPSQFEQAVDSLLASGNLYDQIDLLQYLASCQPIDYYIDQLQATIKELLEEVYLKSMRLQYWSIARQAAGLLRKIVPSLTINITDLVIRQKQVSIGSGPQEYLMSMPTAPDALSKMISEHCNDDVREGPVVQEIIIYLGSLIRTEPHIFDGILRLRTHYIIIALREEISRTNGCDEEEAVEHLMQLSPFEIKSLLGTILSGPRLCDTDIMVRDKPGGLLMLSLPPSKKEKQQQYEQQKQQNNTVTPSTPLAPAATMVVDNNNKLVIRAQSAGYNWGNFARVDINGHTLHGNSRGIHVWAIDRSTQLLLERGSFDTHISTEESLEFKRFIDWLSPGTIVVVAVKDDCTEHLGKEGIEAMENLGSTKIRQVQYRDSYVFIGEKKPVMGTTGHNGSSSTTITSPIIEQHNHTGPTDLIERTITTSVTSTGTTTLGANSKNKHHSNNNNTSIPTPITHCPHSNGRWLRRRKNDGALNRVPPQFFPNTWKILDSSQGLRIRNHTLPRDPTVLEKTAEEFNFALAVEIFLGWFIDPAERQIAVETLTVIYKLKERNPEMQLNTYIDIVQIMDTAVEFFWIKWNKENKDHALSYKENKGLAHKLFYDLPQQGSDDSTFGYLSKSALKVLPIEFTY
ncbi:glycosyl hydrolases family 15-domain-containing protein [Phascolomyces articulosus]|uniref:Glycosyl hydrolases family 15-domain-containing protein n=1 Tax=Phascolomyces articulosus TaxID=60185 RepID=A0AAD5JWH7_9FUNG|nr:glycosyl hydrolases family 15-domain-containing protein [Phascolomyces articulosus]